jgi:hypothetical protein
MKNTLSEPVQLGKAPANLANKPKFSSYFNNRQKFRAVAMGSALLVSAWGGAHLAGWDKFLDPTLPLATDAELNEANYPNRIVMSETLINRINVTARCTITTRSYGLVHVYADIPYGLPEGIEEHQVSKEEDVLPTCINMIRDKFSNGRARNVTYEINIKNAWSGSVAAPGFGPFEDGDENGNGIRNESLPLSLGNKWHDNDAIERLEEAQEDYLSVKQALRDRDNRSANLLGRAWQWTKDTAYSAIGWETMADQIQQSLWDRVTGGNNEAHPS